MIDINKILYASNLYSIEYSGFLSIKLSLFDSSLLYDSCQDVTIEFNTGVIMLNNNQEQIEAFPNILNLHGSYVNYSAIIENQIEISFDNGFILKSIYSQDELSLVDRCWTLKSTKFGTSFILNDTHELFFSENIKELLE
jgi:hypothetical protein